MSNHLGFKLSNPVSYLVPIASISAVMLNIKMDPSEAPCGAKHSLSPFLLSTITMKCVKLMWLDFLEHPLDSHVKIQILAPMT